MDEFAVEATETEAVPDLGTMFAEYERLHSHCSKLLHAIDAAMAVQAAEAAAAEAIAETEAVDEAVAVEAAAAEASAVA